MRSLRRPLSFTAGTFRGSSLNRIRRYCKSIFCCCRKQQLLQNSNTVGRGQHFYNEGSSSEGERDAEGEDYYLRNTEKGPQGQERTVARRHRGSRLPDLSGTRLYSGRSHAGLASGRTRTDRKTKESKPPDQSCIDRRLIAGHRFGLPLSPAIGLASQKFGRSVRPT